MTHTSTEQERDLKDIEQALRLVREAHQHEVDAYRPELYKPECDRRPKPQPDRLGDLICLLQNILYAAQQASRRAQVVPQGWRLVPEWPTVEMSVAGDDVYREDGPDVFSSNTIYTRMLAAAPQPPEAAPSSVSNGRWPDAPPQENIREGAPYSDPEFEKLAREHAAWGTAQSALCAQFWMASQAQRVPLSKRKIRLIDAHSGLDAIEFARAIERAHGIQEQST